MVPAESSRVWRRGVFIRRFYGTFCFYTEIFWRPFLTIFSIPKNSRNKPQGWYFSKALFEGLVFGGAYIRRGLCAEGICVSKSIGLDCSWKEIYHFCFVLLCIRGQIPSTRPPGGLYSEGRFNGGFFALRFWGAYTWWGLFSEFYGIFMYLGNKVRKTQPPKFVGKFKLLHTNGASTGESLEIHKYSITNKTTLSNWKSARI